MEENKLVETMAGEALKKAEEFVPEAKKKGNKLVEKAGYLIGGVALGILGTKGVEKLTGDKVERELKKAEKMEQNAAEIRAKYTPAVTDQANNEEIPDNEEFPEE